MSHMRSYATSMAHLFSLKIEELKDAKPSQPKATGNKYLYIKPLELVNKVSVISEKMGTIKATYLKCHDLTDYRKTSVRLTLESGIDTGLGRIITEEADPTCIIR